MDKDKLRPVEIAKHNNQPDFVGYFHGFFASEDSTILALIEKEDGQITEVYPFRVRFLDR